MKTSFPKTYFKTQSGYTLVEVLVAACLLGVMIGGGVRAAGSIFIAEDTVKTGTVALNLTEAGASLWQLGLTPAEVQSIMPVTTNNEFVNNALVADSAGNSIRFASASTTVTLPQSMGTIESIDVSNYIQDPTDENKYKTVTITVLRDQ